MRLRGEAGFRLNSSCGLGEQPRFSRLHFLFMLLGTWPQRLEASELGSLTRLKVGLFSCHWREHSSAETHQNHQWQDQVVSWQDLEVSWQKGLMEHAGGRSMSDCILNLT